MFQKIAKFKYPVILGIIIVAISLLIQFTSIEPLNTWRTRLELLAYDARMNLFLQEKITKDKRITIINIDEKSLSKEGRWPWSRKKMAKLVNQLSEAGAVVIAFDVIFSEPERNSSEEIIEKLSQNPDARKHINYLQQHSDEFDNDKLFSNALKNKDIILGYIAYTKKSGSKGKLPPPLVIKNKQDIQNTTFLKLQSYTANLPLLQDAALNAGYFTLPTTDIDGVIRRFPIVSEINNQVYASLPLEVFRIYNLVDTIKVYHEKINQKNVLTGIEVIAGKIIPTDGSGHVIIPFRGKAGSYPYISATNILNKTFKKTDIENKIILIGTTAVGLFDLRSVPVQSVYPGVEVHANIISALLDNSFPSEPAWAPGANFVFMLLVGVVLAIGLPLLSPVMQFIFSILIICILVTVNTWFWYSKGLVLSLVSPLFMLFALAIFNFSYGFVSESHRRKNLKDAFSQYIPPELVQQMDKNLSSYAIDGDSREMTVLFSDIVGFTSISEKLTASELKGLLNEYLTPMTEVIFRNNGTIDKYIGDLIMAFWGAPIHDEQHAQHAVISAIEMLNALDRLNKVFKTKNLPPLSVGIGINTGDMNVGDMGSSHRRAYTVIGDSVNLASRLEGLTRYFGVDILISEDTASQLSDKITLLPIGAVKVKGKEEAVKIFSVAGLTKKISQIDISRISQFETFLQYFTKREWVNAEQKLIEMTNTFGESKLYEFYSEQISEIKISNLDDDWCGEIIFTSK